MHIDHSVEINAPIGLVWNIFTDLTCWKEWNKVMENVSSDHDSLREGKSFKFCIRPFAFPLSIQPVVEELVPQKRIVWSGSRHGIHARHQFIFSAVEKKVLVTSRETFSIGFMKGLFFHISRKKLHALSILMLEELKYAAENSTLAGRRTTEEI